MHAASHHRDGLKARSRSRSSSPGAHGAQEVLGTQPQGLSGEVESQPPRQAGTALNLAAFDARLNSRTSSGPHQGFNHLGITTSPCCRPGAWEVFRDRWCFNQPIPLTGAGSWHFLPTLHPSGSLPAFAYGFPGNSTHGDRRGEAVLPRQWCHPHVDPCPPQRWH